MKKLTVVCGPTAVGKTRFSISLAKKLNTEIISADSRQFFREMNIGTAKPDAAELSKVKHHFINSLSVTQEYNAGQYETDCLKLLDKLFQKYQHVIMVGGSGMYIQAVVNGFDQLPPDDLQIRNQLTQLFNDKGIAALQNELKEKDPVYFAKCDQQNPQRLMRAIEVIRNAGKPYSAFLKKEKVKRNFETEFIGLELPREILYSRINERVDEMIHAGLVNEVQSLISFKNLNALQTVGYAELFDYLDGKTSLDEAILLIKQHTRNFAKRQMTWFKKMKEIKWLNAQSASVENLVL